jgi:hypothetical protein
VKDIDADNRVAGNLYFTSLKSNPFE